MVTRGQIIEELTGAFKNLPYALAMWQGGSASFNRADEWSDIDLMLIVEDGTEQQAMNLAGTVLESKFGIDERFEIDPPFWPDMIQTFFRLKKASPFWLVDFSVLPVSAKSKFIEPEIHGEAVVYFDKQEITNTLPVNLQQLRQMLKGRIAKQKKKFDLFRVMVDKEINRKKDIDAFVFYWSYTISPLIEMLRIKHSLYHWNFGSRYLTEHLPPAISDKLKPLYFINDINDLVAKNKQAREWFYMAANEAENSLG